MVKLPPPALLNGNQEQQLRQIYNYLYQMSEQLNLVERVTSPEALTASLSPETSKTYNELRSLITKTSGSVATVARNLQNALNVDIPNNYLNQENYREDQQTLIAGFEGDFLAKSDFGTLSEQQRTAILADVNGIITAFGYDSRLSALDEQATGFAEYRQHSEQYIRAGVVGYEDGVPIAGVIVGNNLTTAMVDDKEIVMSESMYGVFTAGQLSFWKNGQKSCQFDTTTMDITNIAVHGKISHDGWETDTVNGWSLSWVGRDE